MDKQGEIDYKELEKELNDKASEERNRISQLKHHDKIFKGEIFKTPDRPAHWVGSKDGGR